jgi:hypothetical protein
MNAVKAHDEKYTPGAAVVVVPKTTKEICEFLGGAKRKEAIFAECASTHLAKAKESITTNTNNKF